eukprot:7391105-Prymnesium_polylepis.1
MADEAPEHALSEDGDAEEELAQVQDGQRKRARNNQSKRSEQRAKGSARVKAYELPLPTNYKAVAAGGFQKYKLPERARVYQRHDYDYSEQDKDGAVVMKRPSPPSLFTD